MKDRLNSLIRKRHLGKIKRDGPRKKASSYRGRKGLVGGDSCPHDETVVRGFEGESSGEKNLETKPAAGEITSGGQPNLRAHADITKMALGWV